MVSSDFVPLCCYNKFGERPQTDVTVKCPQILGLIMLISCKTILQDKRK